MSRDPQSDSARRSERGANVQDSAQTKAGSDRKVGPGGPEPRAHGTDRGGKGGGRGGGKPPEQEPEHP
jgi:hypothetical protein